MDHAMILDYKLTWELGGLNRLKSSLITIQYQTKLSLELTE